MSAPSESNAPATTHIIGAGLTGLLLADKLANNETAPISLYGDRSARTNHFWGYWDAGETFLDAPRSLAKAAWRHWQIITPQGTATLTGQKTFYRAIASQTYETHLADALRDSKKAHHIARDLSPSEMKDLSGTVFDTAHYQAPKDCMLQHFAGFEVEADAPCFDANTAVLMDFRVTQDHGIHFIYLLPSSDKRALIESTMFSPTLQSDDWYDEQIKLYLKTHFGHVNFTLGAREAGIIPMAPLTHNGPGTPIGLAGGALRASSGYAFFQIHRQVGNFTKAASAKPSAGASRLEQWMDGVFLRVLARSPHRAPEIFLAMAKHLTGDEFAAFMNGHASLRLLLKVILAVPKWPFIRSLL